MSSLRNDDWTTWEEVDRAPSTLPSSARAGCIHSEAGYALRAPMG